MRLFNQILKKILPRRIWLQIFFILSFLVVIPLSVLGFLLIQTSQEAIKKIILNDHKQIAIHATGEIEQYIEKAKIALTTTASILGTLQSETWRKETAIVELSLRYPAFQRISILNQEGEEIVTSQLGAELKNHFEQKYFQQAWQGRVYISDVRREDNDLSVLTMAVPIIQLGKIKEVLLADYTVRGVWDVVDSIKIGKTGRAYVIDQHGRIIAHPDKKLVVNHVQIPYGQITKDILAGKPGNVEEELQGDGSWLISYAPIQKLNWGLVLMQSQKEAYAFSRKMNIQSWILIGLSIVAAVIISLILSRLISQPILKLIEGTNRLAQGDFSQNFRIQRHDEIGQMFFSFNRMSDKLREAQHNEKLSFVGKAAAIIAHELKNSLVMVKTFVHLLPQRHKDEQFIKEFADTIPKELDLWNASLKNMMTFSQQADYVIKDININEIVQEVLLQVSLRAQDSNVVIRSLLGKNIPFIRGDEDKIKQVVLNLVNNSLEASPQGGLITVSTKFVEISDSWKEPYVKIEVSNTGEILDESDMKKIFDPFYTTKKEGMGLGLSICRDIIKNHRGYIGVVNIKNKGPLFTIKLPINPAISCA